MIIDDYTLSWQDLLAKYGVPSQLEANYRKTPVAAIDNTEDGAHFFNTLYREVMRLAAKQKWNKITRTKSGGISISRKNFIPPMWDVRATYSCIEMTVIDKRMIRVQFRLVCNWEKETTISGREAFREFKERCRRKGIELDDYVIDNGIAVKETIPNLLIKMVNAAYKDVEWENCHHIDFHNSFPSGLCNTHPEFREVVEPIYNERKDPEKTDLNKAILNYTIGMFQSIDNTGAAWAHLSKDAITDNNNRLLELTRRLEKSGRLPLLWNTDGVWYQGDVYHGEGEGKNLGEWENDHTNCRLRIKSNGAYEFIEGGKYYPVIRGRTRLDKIKPRDNWHWGDIYGGDLTEPIKMTWIAGVGICDENEFLL